MIKGSLYDLKIGTKLKDNRGNVGIMVQINGAKMIRFQVKGGFKYTVLSKLIADELEIIDN